MSRGLRVRIAPGIYRDDCGFSVIASVGSAPHKITSPELRFPPNTPVASMEAAWHREKMKLKALQERQGTIIERGSLAADVVRYFKIAKLSKQRRQEREQQLKWWTDRVGTRLRTGLTALELREALASLDKAASTVNKYRTALSNVFTVLDGKNAPNPFRDIPRDREPEAERRDQPYELIEAILANIRDRGRGKNPSRTKAILWVLAYTPVTPAQLYAMTPGDVHWDASEITVVGRKKGGGTMARRKPVSPQSLEAIRAFDAAGCWGRRPSKSSMWRIFTKARDKAIAELAKTRSDLDLSRAATMRPYDLRHSFATMVLRTTGSLDVTSQMLDHKSKETTLRYAQGAVEGVLKSAGAAINAGFAAVPARVDPSAEDGTVRPPASASRKAGGRTRSSATIVPSTSSIHRPALTRKQAEKRGVRRMEPRMELAANDARK